MKTKVIAKADETLANRMAGALFPFEQIREAHRVMEETLSQRTQSPSVVS